MSADFEPDALLKHVLCAVDLSSCSVAALSRAIQLADVYGARLDVLHILDASDTARGLLKSRRDDLLLHLQQIVEGTLDRQQISVTTSIAHGDPVREILSHLRQ